MSGLRYIDVEEIAKVMGALNERCGGWRYQLDSSTAKLTKSIQVLGTEVAQVQVNVLVGRYLGNKYSLIHPPNKQQSEYDDVSAIAAAAYDAIREIKRAGKEDLMGGRDGRHTE